MKEQTIWTRFLDYEIGFMLRLKFQTVQFLAPEICNHFLLSLMFYFRPFGRIFEVLPVGHAARF